MASGTLPKPLGGGLHGSAHGEVHHRRRHAPRRAPSFPPGTRTPLCRRSPRPCSPTEEVVLRNVPRIRDVEAMIELLVRLGVKAEWRDENVVALRADEVTSTAVDPELRRAHPRLVPARRAAARPLRPRRHAAARRRRDRPPPPRPHFDAFRALGAEVSASAPFHLPAPDGLHACDFFMDEPSVMATENALMAAALAPGLHRDPQRRRRAARAGPRAPADADGRAHRGHRLEPDDRARPGGARRRRLHDRARLHRGRQLHRARRLHRRRAAHPRRGARRPAHDPALLRAAGLPDRVRRQRRGRARRTSSCASSRTRATRSRRSRTGPGPRSRPTSRASRSPWPPRPTASS